MVDAFRLVQRYRQEAVVIACQGAGAIWVELSRSEELYIPFVGS